MSSRPKKRTESKPASTGLLTALKFCQLVTKSEGAPFETHILLSNYTAVAFNGVLATGIKIDEDINGAPNANLIVQALSKCGDNLSITQLDQLRLSIKSNKFKAIVPCIDSALMTAAIPDPQVALLNDRFKEAMAAVCTLPSETAQSVIAASILMAGASLIATDRKVMMEYWHGQDLPYGIALPKAFATALIKCPKSLRGFGFSTNSATFWFEDDSWLRSQFFAEPWPDIRTILDRKCNPWPIHADFYRGLDSVEPFSETGDVYFDSGIMRSDHDENVGASFEIFGLPKGPVFSIKQLNLIRPFVKEIDFMAQGTHTTNMCLWYGESCRGAIAGRG